MLTALHFENGPRYSTSAINHLSRSSNWIMFWNLKWVTFYSTDTTVCVKVVQTQYSEISLKFKEQFRYRDIRPRVKTLPTDLFQTKLSSHSAAMAKAITNIKHTGAVARHHRPTWKWLATFIQSRARYTRFEPVSLAPPLQKKKKIKINEPVGYSARF